MELSELATFGAALLAVLALIMFIAWVLRRFFGGSARPGHPTLRRRERRLGVVEAAQIGTRHRLLLVRRDDREHLLLIGGTTDLVIETGIVSAGTEAEVNIRSVEPRFDADNAEQQGGYRPAQERDSGRGFGRDAFTRPSFSSAFPALRQDDEEHTSGSLQHDADEPEAVQDDDRLDTRAPAFTLGQSRYDDAEEEPGYPAPAQQSYAQDDNDVAFDDRDPPYRHTEPSIGHHDADRSSLGFGDELRSEHPDERHQPAASDDDGGEEPAEARTHSRILSRFLKKDGP